MDPVFLVFWCTVVVLSGYLASYAWLGWHIGASACVLVGFCAIGALAQFGLGAAGWPVPIWVAATVGLGAGADTWRRQRGWSVAD
jgi:hypothetical protein